MKIKGDLEKLPEFKLWLQQFIIGRGRDLKGKFITVKSKKSQWGRDIHLDSRVFTDWYNNKREEYEGLKFLETKK